MTAAVTEAVRQQRARISVDRSEDEEGRTRRVLEFVARVVRTAYRRFGKGSGHPARLNIGECFAYALARGLGEPLLFKGDDFKRTDIELVIEPILDRHPSEIVASYGTATP